MQVRDAVEDDAEAMSALTTLSTSAVVGLVHERTVAVAEREGAVVGFVAFDAREDAVFVTQLHGGREAMLRLLDEPTRFAASVDLPVEMLLPVDDERAGALEAAGFDDDGAGPRFDGERTRRFRLSP